MLEPVFAPRTAALPEPELLVVLPPRTAALPELLAGVRLLLLAGVEVVVLPLRTSELPVAAFPRLLVEAVPVAPRLAALPLVAGVRLFPLTAEFPLVLPPRTEALPLPEGVRLLLLAGAALPLPRLSDEVTEVTFEASCARRTSRALAALFTAEFTPAAFALRVVNELSGCILL